MLRRTTEIHEFNCLGTLVRILKAQRQEVQTTSASRAPAAAPGTSQSLLRLERRVYQNLFFYIPLKGERVWTGDIFRNVGQGKYYDYAIVVTPACDLARQGKTTTLTVAYAFPLKESYLRDPEYPPYMSDPPLMKRLKNLQDSRRLGGESTPFTEVSGDILEKAKERFFNPKFRDLPDWFHQFWAFIDKERQSEPFAICFNFNNVRTVDLKEINEKWTRVCRLDSPYLESMLVKFGSHSFGIGAPVWNYGDVSESGQG